MQYTTINVVMDRVTRHPLLGDISKELVAEYVADFIRIIGLKQNLIDKTAVIPVEQYRAELPCDLKKLTQVRLIGPDTKKLPAYRYSTDSFQMSPLREDIGDLTYKTEGKCIFLSTPEYGEIEISYKASLVDDNNYPLIPDDELFIIAAVLYIKKEFFTDQCFDTGKIRPEVLKQTQEDYAWAVARCKSRLSIPTTDEMETLGNMLTAPVDRSKSHANGFINESAKKRLRRRF